MNKQVKLNRVLLVSLEVISEEQKRVYEMAFAAKRIRLYFETAKVYSKQPYNMAFIAKLDYEMTFEHAIYALGALANELGQDCIAYAYNATGKAFDAYGLVGERTENYGVFNPEYFPFTLAGEGMGQLSADYRVFHSNLSKYWIYRHADKSMINNPYKLPME